MRILIVAPDLKIGGVERALIFFLCSAPVEEDITLRLLSDGGVLEKEVPPGIHIERAHDASTLEAARAGVSYLLGRAGLWRIFSLAKAIYHRFGKKMMVRSKSKDYFDIAIAFSDGIATWYTAEIVSAARKLAFIHTDIQAAGYNRATEGSTYSHFDLIYFVSEAARQSFLKVLPSCREKALLQPVSIDRDAICLSAQVQPPFAMPAEGLRICTVGRLSVEKGMRKIPGLLRALLDDGIAATWYVVGDGPERGAIVQRAKELGVSDQLFLAGIRENPYSIMSRCDIYVQPSDYEGYCVALAEARALSMPCVCCDFCGAREQLQDGVTGFITGMKEEELYPAIRALAASPELRARFTSALNAALVGSSPDYSDFWRSTLHTADC